MSDYDDNKLITERRRKLGELRQTGNAYPNTFRRDSLADDLQQRYAKVDKDDLEAEPVRVSVAGRMMAKRVMGKASFTHIQDMSGTLQLYLQRDSLGESYQAFKTWDIGDIIGAEGTLFRTQKGELSVKAERLELLTKALRPLPEKFHGLADQELRYRQRYVDLIVNDSSRHTFVMRSRIVAYLRQFFAERGFLEVETPMMQPLPGGATARPFMTHHNALDMDLYLRVAPELYLKRLVVGGFERVFEINRNFRNEGLSPRHNPEFTMLEFYQAYADYRDLMDLSEVLIRGMATVLLGDTTLSYQGETIDLSQPFRRLSVVAAIQERRPEISTETLNQRSAVAAVAEAEGIKVDPEWGVGRIQMELFEAVAESELRQPTFITAYPTEVSPLSRGNDSNPTITDRFELYIGGRELANGFSELNDPEDQAERFRAQVAAKDAGDEEAMYFDSDYIRALEYGLPPTAGEGIGVDRLVMLFTDSASIRDVLLFPHLRPEALPGQ